MTHIVFDFETVRDEAVPHEPRVEVERISQRAHEDCKIEHSYVLEREPVDPFPPACHHRLVCGALLFLGRRRSEERDVPGPAVARAKILSGSEPDIICQFMDAVRRHMVMVSFGGRGFDVPVNILRGMRYGIDVSDLLDRDFSDRYRGHRHIDLVEHLTSYGATQKMKMVAAARLVGWPGKLDVDGSQVDELVAAGRIRDVERYCLQDTANEAAILLRLLLCRGSLTPGDYREHAVALLQLVDEHPDLWPLGSRINRDLFLYCHDPKKSVPLAIERDEHAGEEEDRDQEKNGVPVEIATLSVDPSGSVQADLDLRIRIAEELLIVHGVSNDGGDLDIPSGKFSIFLEVPPGRGEAVLGAVRRVVAALGITCRSSYRAPGDKESRSLFGIGSLYIDVDPRSSEDLALRDRVMRLLEEDGVSIDGHDLEDGAVGIFCVVPFGQDELVAAKVRKIVVALGAAARCSYGGPDEAAVPLEEPASAESCGDCRGEGVHAPDCGSQSRTPRS